MKIILAASLAAALSWSALWWTPDQHGQRLEQSGDFAAAADAYDDPFRRGTAWYRAGEFEKAEREFARVATAESEFNRGNCLVMRGKYEDAVERYDRALKLKPDFEDAEVNRSIAVARAERVKQEGGEMGQQEIGADEIVFDKKKDSGGEETEVSQEQAMSDQSMQAMWLRRVQTKPADFLKSKFAYQLQFADENSEDE